jgi:hypothetical protein
MWIDIAGIVFICVTMNHLGLVKAIEETFDKELPIVNCVRCSTFWVVLFYTLFVTRDVIASLAISFLSGYSAIWLELAEGYIDTLYVKLYGKIYKGSYNTDSASTDNGNSAGSVS